jgi:quinol monooxygenase YgiN
MSSLFADHDVDPSPAMPAPLIVVDTSKVHDGRLEELRAAVAELVEFVQANEVEPLAYNVYFDEQGTTMTVVQVHPSSESFEHHMKIAGPVFRKFADLLTLSRIDFYGAPSRIALDQMRRKAELLGNAPVVVNDLQTGFMRFGTG